MKVDDLLEGRVDDLEEWKASKELCKSSKSNKELGASALASCKAQGYRAREGSMKHNVGKGRKKVAGKKIKGKRYSGPLPDWSKQFKKKGKAGGTD